jgi:hypothetical protein
MFTRREKIVLVVWVFLAIAFFVFPALIDPDYEMLYLLFIVVPVGWLIATDKERMERTKL